MHLKAERRPVSRLITHASCPDGVASAWMFVAEYPEVDILWAHYDDLPNIEPHAGDVYCDITPHESMVDRALEVGAVVLDHHPTQRHITERFEAAGRGHYADNRAPEGAGVSGAVLAYWYVFGHGEEGPLRATLPHVSRADLAQLASLAGIRDTWMTGSPLWDKSRLCAAAFLMLDRDDLASYRGAIPDEIVARAQMEVRRRDEACRSYFGRVVLREERSGTLLVAWVNASDGIVSDLAEHMRQVGSEADVLAVFHALEPGKTKVSLRSIDPSVNVGALASARGGGGHHGAAAYIATDFDWSLGSPRA